MARRGSNLAARFRAAMEREKQESSSEEAAREQAVSAARAARAKVLDELAAFGTELGFVTVQRRDEAVRLVLDERWVAFVPDEEDPGGVAIEISAEKEGVEHRLYREPALQDRWVWMRTRRGRQDRLPLFDQGLELLLVHGLGLPEPDGTAAPSVEVTEDSTVPGASKRSL